MSLFELFILSVGLSMDAFAVSICKGLAMEKLSFKSIGIVGLWFGSFQAIMPFIGYILGKAFKVYIENFDHWIAFILLGIIGANMIKESLEKDEEKADASLSFKIMFTMAIATSIDALAAGITLILPGVSIFTAIALIGLITFFMSVFGVKIGNLFGVKYKSKAEFAGGFILIVLGFKVLFEHIDILNF